MLLTFQKYLTLKVIAVNASDRFVPALKGVTDPEEKRKIIGAEFIAVFEEEARKLGHIEFLAQGTLYPDVIEAIPGGPQGHRGSPRLCLCR